MSGIGTLNIVNPIRRLFKRMRFMEAAVVQLKVTRSLMELAGPASDGHRGADETTGGEAGRRQQRPATAGGPTATSGEPS